MKKALLVLLLSGSIASAGVLKVVTYPARHPVKTVKKVTHVAVKVIY